MNVSWKSDAATLAEAVRRRDVSAVELTRAALARVEKLDATLHAFCTPTPELALREAEAVDRAIAAGQTVGPLAGVPYGIKDLICSKDVLTMSGAVAYADFVPDEDDVVVERMRAAGAVSLGKTTVPEFGYSGVGHSPVSATTVNPWNIERTSGGSSAGSGAAVAAGLCPMALGSDGGGSVRIPSSFCGLVGVKASMGRVPLYPGTKDERYPGVSSWELLEHIGPMTRTVRDAALMLSVIAGPDERDRLSIPTSDVDWLELAKPRRPEGAACRLQLRLGLCRRRSGGAAGGRRGRACVREGPWLHRRGSTSWLYRSARRVLGAGGYGERSEGHARNRRRTRQQDDPASGGLHSTGLDRRGPDGRDHGSQGGDQQDVAFYAKVRPVADADAGRAAVRAAHPGCREDRRANGDAVPVARFHLPVQHDRSTCGERPRRIYQNGPAGRVADRRAPPRRRLGAASRRVVRGGEAVGGCVARNGAMTTTDQFRVAVEPYYRPVGDEVKVFEAAYRHRLPVMLKGPTGCGKTRFLEYMAWWLDRPLITVAAHEDMTAADLVGRFLLVPGETVWHDGPLTLAVRGGAICYIDEIVEARQDTTVVIHPLTDARRILPLEKKNEQVAAHPDFQLVICTIPGTRAP